MAKREVVLEEPAPPKWVVAGPNPVEIGGVVHKPGAIFDADPAEIPEHLRSHPRTPAVAPFTAEEF